MKIFNVIKKAFRKSRGAYLSILIVLLSFAFLLLANCQGKVIAPKLSGLPSKVKVTHASGISVRESTLGDSKIIGTAQLGYEYPVTEGFAAYYQIKLPDGKEGWISANPGEKWTEIEGGNKVKILLASGITARSEPYKKGDVVGAAISGYSFELIAAEYQNLKIKLPDGIEGWIYIGTVEDPWVEYFN